MFHRRLPALSHHRYLFSPANFLDLTKHKSLQRLYIAAWSRRFIDYNLTPSITIIYKGCGDCSVAFETIIFMFCCWNIFLVRTIKRQFNKRMLHHEDNEITSQTIRCNKCLTKISGMQYGNFGKCNVWNTTSTFLAYCAMINLEVIFYTIFPKAKKC